MILIEFWGNLKDFARGEVRAIYEGEKIDYRVVEDDFPAMVIDSPVWDVLKRAGFIRYISRHIKSDDNIPAIDMELDEFAVRARRYNPWGVRSDLAEREIGGMIKGKVNLKNPKTVVRVAIANKIHVGILLYDFSREKFEERRGSNLPISYPITMHPRYARALINLARVKSGDRILDPFCGTGVILIEGALMGMKMYGSDVDDRMIFAARKNMERFSVNAELSVKDVGEISGNYDAIVTDPPYGRSSSPRGESITSLYSRAFKKFSDITDKLAIVLPSQKAIELGKRYFTLKEFYPVRVHKSLTRYYCFFAR